MLGTIADVEVGFVPKIVLCLGNVGEQRSAGVMSWLADEKRVMRGREMRGRERPL